MKRISTVLLLLLTAVAAPRLQARDFGLKTNLLSDAMLNINLGAELTVSPRVSVDFGADLNYWTVGDDKKWRHWTLQPEVRWWTCDATEGHFLGAHLLGGEFNFGNINVPFKFLGAGLGDLRHSRHEGWFGGVGVAYGYSWVLNPHFNLEAEIGVGYVHARYDIYECAGCGRKVGEDNANYFGPTKLALNLVYIF